MPLAGMGCDPTIKPEWGAMLDVSRLSAQGLANWFVLNEGGGAPRDVVGGAGGALTSGIGWSASEEGPCLVKNASTATTTDYFDTGLRVSSGSGTIVFRAYPAAAYNSASIEMLWVRTRLLRRLNLAVRNTRTTICILAGLAGAWMGGSL